MVEKRNGKFAKVGGARRVHAYLRLGLRRAKRSLVLQVCGIICTAEIGQNVQHLETAAVGALDVRALGKDETYAIGPSYNGEAQVCRLTPFLLERCGLTSSTLVQSSGVTMYHNSPEKPRSMFTLLQATVSQPLLL